MASQEQRKLAYELAGEFRRSGYKCVRSAKKYNVYQASDGDVAIIPTAINSKKDYRKFLNSYGLKP